MKKIIVNVIPPCISWNREEQYIRMTEQKYRAGNLPDYCEIIAENDECVEINFYR